METTCRWACLCVWVNTHSHILYPLLQHLSNTLLAAVQWRLCDCQYCGSAPRASASHQCWLDYPDVCTPRHLTISQHLHMQPQHSTLLLMCGGCVRGVFVWFTEQVCAGVGAFIRRDEEKGGEEWQLSLAKRKTNKLQFDAETLLFKVETK